MRDIKRIPHIMKKLERLWVKHPDLRLGQLIVNVVDQEYVYNIEDERLIDLLEEVYDRIDSINR